MEWFSLVLGDCLGFFLQRAREVHQCRELLAVLAELAVPCRGVTSQYLRTELKRGDCGKLPTQVVRDFLVDETFCLTTNELRQNRLLAREVTSRISSFPTLVVA